MQAVDRSGRQATWCSAACECACVQVFRQWTKFSICREEVDMAERLQHTPYEHSLVYGVFRPPTIAPTALRVTRMPDARFRLTMLSYIQGNSRNT